MPISPFGGISTLVHLGIILTRKSLAFSGFVAGAAKSHENHSAAHARAMRGISFSIMLAVVIGITTLVGFIVRQSIQSTTSNAHVAATFIADDQFQTIASTAVYRRNSAARDEAFNQMLAHTSRK